jgi:hypothetical protein
MGTESRSIEAHAPVQAGRFPVWLVEGIGYPHQAYEGDHEGSEDAGHVLQEDKGPELARVILDFMAQTPVGRMND